MLTLIRCLFHPRVSTVACKRPWSFCQKCRWQVTSKHAYTLDPTRLEWADNATVQAQCGNLSGNKLMQLVRKHLATVVSVCWATVAWSWPKKWNWWARADLHLKEKHRQGVNPRTFPPNPCKWGKSHLQYHRKGLHYKGLHQGWRECVHKIGFLDGYKRSE